MTGAVRSDGLRVVIEPADVSGRFATARKVVFAVLIGVYVALPFVAIGGHPAVFLDVPVRRFYLFGGVFSASDIPMTVFFVLGVGFTLFAVTALLGRVWCGWGCPQTVFLDGVYRRIERVIQGPRVRRIRRDAGPLTLDRAWRKAATHALFAAVSLVLAHVLLSYFVTMPALGHMVLRSPAEHPTSFIMAMAVSGLLYFNFAWFREQLCLIICPYGRLQGVLVDDDTLVVGYDAGRGEPRGKVSAKASGDCVDCKRCVVVCPTAIDIRDGLQLDCIGCTACIDACDEVMAGLSRKPGLIRYDSLRGLRGEARRFLRPRIYAYGAVLGGLALAGTLVLGNRRSFEAHLLRPPGIPFTVSDGVVYDPFDVHLVNKREEPVRLRLVATSEAEAGAEVTVPDGDIVLGPLEERHIPVTVKARVARRDRSFAVKLRTTGNGDTVDLEAHFVGPQGAPR